MHRAIFGYIIYSGYEHRGVGPHGEYAVRPTAFAPITHAAIFDQDAYFQREVDVARSMFHPDDDLLVTIDSAFGEDAICMHELAIVFNRIINEAETWGREPRDYLAYLHAVTQWQNLEMLLCASEVIAVSDGIGGELATTKRLRGMWEIMGQVQEFVIAEESHALELCIVLCHGDEDEASTVLVSVSAIDDYDIEE